MMPEPSAEEKKALNLSLINSDAHAARALNELVNSDQAINQATHAKRMHLRYRRTAELNDRFVQEYAKDGVIPPEFEKLRQSLIEQHKGAFYLSDGAYKLRDGYIHDALDRNRVQDPKLRNAVEKAFLNHYNELGIEIDDRPVDKMLTLIEQVRKQLMNMVKDNPGKNGRTGEIQKSLSQVEYQLVIEKANTALESTQNAISLFNQEYPAQSPKELPGSGESIKLRLVAVKTMLEDVITQNLNVQNRDPGNFIGPHGPIVAPRVPVIKSRKAIIER